MKREHIHNRLLLLIVVSAFVHALFLYKSTSEITIASQHGANFVVQLKTIYPNSKQSSSIQTKKRLTKNTIKEFTQKNSQTKLYAVTNHRNLRQDTTSASNMSHDAVRSTLLTKIKIKFTQHFRYPQFAQRKGWQGKVSLAFDINKQGNINNIHIKNSSGYAVLDQAAHNSLNKIKKIVINDWPFRAKQSFNLPVIYKLYEG